MKPRKPHEDSVIDTLCKQQEVTKSDVFDLARNGVLVGDRKAIVIYELLLKMDLYKL